MRKEYAAERECPLKNDGNKGYFTWKQCRVARVSQRTKKRANDDESTRWRRTRLHTAQTTFLVSYYTRSTPQDEKIYAGRRGGRKEQDLGFCWLTTSLVHPASLRIPVHGIFKKLPGPLHISPAASKDAIVLHTSRGLRIRKWKGKKRKGRDTLTSSQG